MTPESILGPPAAAPPSAARMASQASANAAANRPDEKDVQALAEDLREHAPAVIPPSLPGVGGKLDLYAGEDGPAGAPKAPEPKDAVSEKPEDPPYDPLGARWERVMEAPELPYLRPLSEGKGVKFDSTM